MRVTGAMCDIIEGGLVLLRSWPKEVLCARPIRRWKAGASGAKENGGEELTLPLPWNWGAQKGSPNLSYDSRGVVPRDDGRSESVEERFLVCPPVLRFFAGDSELPATKPFAFGLFPLPTRF